MSSFWDTSFLSSLNKAMEFAFTRGDIIPELYLLFSIALNLPPFRSPHTTSTFFLARVKELVLVAFMGLK